MAVFFDSSPDVLTPEVLAGLDDDQLWQVIYDNLHPGKDTRGLGGAACSRGGRPRPPPANRPARRHRAPARRARRRA